MPLPAALHEELRSLLPRIAEHAPEIVEALAPLLDEAPDDDPEDFDVAEKRMAERRAAPPAGEGDGADEAEVA